MKVRWSRASKDQLIAIRTYIQANNPEAAERVRLRVIETVRLLSALPRLGHPGGKQGTRQFVIPRLPFVLVYRVDIADEDELIILGIFHTAQGRGQF